MGALGQNVIGELLQRSDIVENPEAAAVGRDNQVLKCSCTTMPETARRQMVWSGSQLTPR